MLKSSSILLRFGDYAVPFEWTSKAVGQLIKYSNFVCLAEETSLLSCTYIKNSTGLICNSEMLVGLKCPAKLKGICEDCI